MVSKTYDPAAAVIAQRKYCDEHNAPFFAPTGNIGYGCYRCNQNIYLPLGHDELFDRDSPGISVEEAATKLITGCPFCHYSFCD